MRFAPFVAALGFLLSACGPKPTAAPTATPFPTSAFADINASATEIATAMAGLDEVAGIKIMTCEALAAGDAGALGAGIYLGMVTSILGGTPVAGQALDLTSDQRAALVGSLRNLKTEDGKFCGKYDDPGGWE